MGLFGRSRKSEADKTLEQLQAADDLAEPAMTQPNVVSSTVGTAKSGFSMPVENAFSITGRGLVVTGTIEAGTVSVGQNVTVVSQIKGRSRPRKVAGIECRRSMKQSAQSGDEIGLLIPELSRGDVAAGDRIVS